MLPDIHLDEITFEEMLEKARNKIAGCYPAWTDFNYHDPGITLIELFAWLKEIQQYELNHVGDAHKRSYLHLLGTVQQGKKGAGTFVCVKASRELCVPKGVRFLASGISFETRERYILPGVSINCCFVRSDKKELLGYLDSEQMAIGNLLSFYPFGRQAEPGTCLYIGCSGPLPAKKELCLTVRVSEDRKKPRNPADADTVPLASFGCSYWNGSSYRPAKILRDETFGMLFDGQIRFLLEEEMALHKVDEEEGYFLRFKLEKSQYEMPPALSFLDLNTLKVTQKETVAAWLTAAREEGTEVYKAEHALCIRGEIRAFGEEDGLYRELRIKSLRREEKEGCVRIAIEKEEFDGGELKVLASRKEDWYDRHQVLGIGHGFPGECFLLDEDCVLQEELVILVEETERPGYYRRWEARESFAHSGPEDCHYRIDGVQGKILFGDGFHGMAPEGQVLLASYVRVLGEEGNIKAHRLLPDPEGILKDEKADNPWKASGGREEESIEEAFQRVRLMLFHNKSMVTAGDYEQEVCRTPGLKVESCRAIFGDGPLRQTAQIVVKPCSLEKRPQLTGAFIQNIQNHLEAKRLLGIRIQVLSPVYIHLAVYLEVTVHPQYQKAEEMIREAVKEYLSPMTAHFGRTASYSGLYGQIDRLPCVYEIRSLLMEARGNGVQKSPYGDIHFPGNGIAEEIEVQCSSSFAAE